MDPQPRTTDVAAARSLTVHIVDRSTDLQALGAEWAELLQRYPGRNPFLTFDWVCAWLECLGERVRPFVVVVRETTRVRAIAPLCIHPDGLLTFIGYPQNDYADIIVDGEPRSSLERIVEVIFENRHQWKRAVFDQMSEERSQANALREVLALARRPFRFETGDACAAMSLADPDAAKKQYNKSNMSNYINWFRRNGDLRFEHAGDTAEALQLLEPLIAQHIERWSGTSTPSSFRRPQMQEFYRAFVERLAPKGQVRISALRLDEHFLALYLYFDFDGVQYMYKPTFNLAYGKRSPGQVILRFLLDAALESGIRELDFTRGDEGYKNRFANVFRQNCRITLYRDGLAQRRAELAHAVMHNPIADQVLRSEHSRRWKHALLRWYRNR